ncbi:unnamed protein product [Calypogeia fissa]
MSIACPFARLSVSDKAERPAGKTRRKRDKENAPEAVVEYHASEDQPDTPKCPVSPHERKQAPEDASVAPKCPLGYDSVSFKIGPLSCVICRALLFDSSRCVPCQHIFCRDCISRFQDCVLCGADIERIDDDPQLQGLVERFIEGHARIKRSTVLANGGSSPREENASNVVSYEDVSLARGSFLIQHAMRAFQAQNFKSAKSRLQLCADDTREELSRSGTSTETCSQLGAVLGMLGDCCRQSGDAEAAMAYYQESVDLLMNLPNRDEEVVHALSVSLNKLGDLKYYAQDLAAARTFYSRALELRRQATDLTKLSSQVLDVAVSLAKVADVNRALGNEGSATEGFQEAVKMLEGLPKLNTKEKLLLEPRRLSVLEFLHNQLAAEKA